MCTKIMNKLIELEKYSTGKNKKTYIMVPFDHPKYKFPLNLEDRLEYLKNNSEVILSQKIKFKENISKKDKNILLEFKLTKKPIKDEIDKLIEIGFNSKNDTNWSCLID